MKTVKGYGFNSTKTLHTPLLQVYSDDSQKPATFWTKKNATATIKSIDGGNNTFNMYPLTIMRTSTWWKPYQIFVIQSETAKEKNMKRQRYNNIFYQLTTELSKCKSNKIKSEQDE